MDGGPQHPKYFWSQGQAVESGEASFPFLSQVVLEAVILNASCCGLFCGDVFDMNYKMLLRHTRAL